MSRSRLACAPRLQRACETLELLLCGMKLNILELEVLSLGATLVHAVASAFHVDLVNDDRAAKRQTGKEIEGQSDMGLSDDVCAPLAALEWGGTSNTMFGSTRLAQ